MDEMAMNRNNSVNGFGRNSLSSPYFTFISKGDMGSPVLP